MPTITSLQLQFQGLFSFWNSPAACQCSLWQSMGPAGTKVPWRRDYLQKHSLHLFFSAFSISFQGSIQEKPYPEVKSFSFPYRHCCFIFVNSKFTKFTNHILGTLTSSTLNPSIAKYSANTLVPLEFGSLFLFIGTGLNPGPHTCQAMTLPLSYIFSD